MIGKITVTSSSSDFDPTLHPVSEIKEWLLEDNEDGPPLEPAFVESCSDRRLYRIAELAGDRFRKWVNKRLPPDKQYKGSVYR